MMVRDVSHSASLLSNASGSYIEEQKIALAPLF